MYIILTTQLIITKTHTASMQTYVTRLTYTYSIILIMQYTLRLHTHTRIPKKTYIFIIISISGVRAIFLQFCLGIHELKWSVAYVIDSPKVNTHIYRSTHIIKNYSTFYPSECELIFKIIASTSKKVKN